MRALSIIFLVLNFYSSSAQSWEENLSNLIANTNNYRFEILTQDTSELIRLSERMNSWKAIVPLDELYDNLIENLNYGAGQNLKLDKIKKYIYEEYPTPKTLEFLKQFDDSDYELLKYNGALIDLIDENILSADFPFVLQKNEGLLTELKYYDIKNGDKIAEIGAGNGSFGILLTLMNPNIKLTLNELNYKLVKYMRNKFDHLNALYQLENSKIILGSKKKTKLRSRVNKVIIRNTFHHISEHQKILKSIFEKLDTNGSLFIQEPKKTNSSCHFLLTEEELLKRTIGPYFTFKEKTELERMTIYKFEKARAANVNGH